MLHKLCASLNIWRGRTKNLIFFLFHLVTSARLATHSIMKGLRFNILFVTCASLLYFKHNYTMSLRRCSCYDKILSLSTYTMEYVVFVLLFCLISKFEKWSSRARAPQTPQPFRTAAGFLVYFEFICYKDFFIFHICNLLMKRK